MGVRIWHQTMTDVARYPAYGDALLRTAREVTRPDTEVDVHGVAPGTYGDLPPAAVSIHPFASHTLLDQVVGQAISAEQQGYDVFVLGSYSEPFLRTIRSAVDIPVVSLAEATMLTGCSLAARVGVVTITKPVQWMIEHHLDYHHLRSRFAPIRTVEPELLEDQLENAFTDPGPVIEAFSAAARRCIDDFADVIIPAEGLFTQVLAQAGIREIDGVSVMDCVAVTALQAESMALLHRYTGLIQGRRWEYPLVPPGIRAQLQKHAAEHPLSASRLD